MNPKKMLFIFILLSSIFSCKKETAVAEIKYEVHLINSNSWGGVIIDENGVITNLDNMPADWKYTFKNTNNLCCLTPFALPDGFIEGACTQCDATMKIYVHEKVVASGNTSANLGGLYYTF